MKFEILGVVYEENEVQNKELKCYQPLFTLEEAILLYTEGVLQGRRKEDFEMNTVSYFKAKFNLDI